MKKGEVDLVALSASSYSADATALAADVARVARACRAAGASLVLGGSGAWPEAPAGALRLRRFEELAALAGKLSR